MSANDDARALLAAVGDFQDDPMGYRPAADRAPLLAAVDPAYTGTGYPKVTIDGESALTTKTYPFLGSAPRPSSRVLMVPIGRGYLILSGGIGVEAGTPAGNVEWTARSAAPTGWLLCDGSAVSRTTYADLFAAIGTTYGAGNGTTTFNVPNIKGRVVVGRDGGQSEFDALGETGGAKTHTLTIGEIPAHTHLIGRVDVGASGTTRPLASDSTPSSTSSTESAGGGGAHNNLQPYIVLNPIIKT